VGRVLIPHDARDHGRQSSPSLLKQTRSPPQTLCATLHTDRRNGTGLGGPQPPRAYAAVRQRPPANIRAIRGTACLLRSLAGWRLRHYARPHARDPCAVDDNACGASPTSQNDLLCMSEPPETDQRLNAPNGSSVRPPRPISIPLRPGQANLEPCRLADDRLVVCCPQKEAGRLQADPAALAGRCDEEAASRLPGLCDAVKGPGLLDRLVVDHHDPLALEEFPGLR